MHAFTTVAVAALAGMAAAAPLEAREYYGVGLTLHYTTAASDNTTSPAPVQINQLAVLNPPFNLWEISFDQGTAVNVDINSIECRAYKDNAGTIPGSAPFTNANPALVATPGNGDDIGAILCYITEQDSSS